MGVPQEIVVADCATACVCVCVCVWGGVLATDDRSLHCKAEQGFQIGSKVTGLTDHLSLAGMR